MTRRKRNPWHGINDRREFTWDMRHPLAFFADAWDGVRGRNGLEPGVRWLGLFMIVLGLVYTAGGLLAVVMT